MLIGLIGLIGSGKGTAGDILVKECGFKQDSFAKGVKDACTAIFGWDRALLEGDTADSRAFREAIDPYWSKALGKPNFTPRLALQWLGTEAGRNVFGADLWVASLLKRIDSDYDYVITDVRFPNELSAIKKAGGYNIHITRGRYPDWYHDALRVNTPINFGNPAIVAMNPIKGDEIPGVHYSEWAWVGNPNIETIITNDGTIQQLQNALAMFLSQH